MGGKLERTYLGPSKSSQQLPAQKWAPSTKNPNQFLGGENIPWLPWMSRMSMEGVAGGSHDSSLGRNFQVHPHDAYLLSLYLVLGVGSWKHQHIQSNVNFDAWSENWGKNGASVWQVWGLKYFWFYFSLRANEQEGGGLNTNQKRRG